MKLGIIAKYKNSLTFETRSIRILKRKSGKFAVLIFTAQDQYGCYDINKDKIEATIQELRLILEGDSFNEITNEGK